MTTMTELEVLEELIDDDPFIRAYPSFQKYLDEWDESGGPLAYDVPDEVIFEFYAEKLTVDQALSIWFTYND